MFRNQSGEARRLSASLGTVVEEGTDNEVPLLMCTTLVDDGGAQNITVNVALPSITSPDGYSFFVPGVESAQLKLIVP